MSFELFSMGTAPTLRSDGTEEPIGGISDKISNMISSAYNKLTGRKSSDNIKTSNETQEKDVPSTQNLMPPPTPAPPPVPPPMTTTKTNSEGIVGKFMNKINRAYDKITDGKSKNNDEEVKKAKDRLKWAWDNKGEIFKTGGEIAEAIGEATDNKYLKAGAKTMNTIGNGFERIENKDREKELKMKLGDLNRDILGNYYLNYLNYPRIHYSRKPASYKIYRNKKYFIKRRRKTRR